MDDPYAPPSAELEHGPDAAAFAIRARHARAEQSVQTMGLVFAGGGALLGSGGLYQLGLALFRLLVNHPVFSMAATVVLGCVLLLVGALLGALGVRLWQLSPSARHAGLLASSVLLPLFPVGTFLGICGLVTLLGAKGRFVLSDDYARVLAVTRASEGSGQRLLRRALFAVVVLGACIPVLVTVLAGL